MYSIKANEFRKFYNDFTKECTAEGLTLSQTVDKALERSKSHIQDVKYGAYFVVGSIYLRSGSVVVDNSWDNATSLGLEQLMTAYQRAVIVDTKMWLLVEIGLHLTAIESGLLEVEFKEDDMEY